MPGTTLYAPGLPSDIVFMEGTSQAADSLSYWVSGRDLSAPKLLDISTSHCAARSAQLEEMRSQKKSGPQTGPNYVPPSGSTDSAWSRKRGPILASIESPFFVPPWCSLRNVVCSWLSSLSSDGAMISQSRESTHDSGQASLRFEEGGGSFCSQFLCSLPLVTVSLSKQMTHVMEP